MPDIPVAPAICVIAGAHANVAPPVLGGGACDYPDEGDVRDGVTYGGGTGTLELPAEADVRDGTSYGAGGTEFTGTLDTGGGASVHGFAF